MSERLSVPLSRRDVLATVQVILGRVVSCEAESGGDVTDWERTALIREASELVGIAERLVRVLSPAVAESRCLACGVELSADWGVFAALASRSRFWLCPDCQDKGWRLLKRSPVSGSGEVCLLLQPGESAESVGDVDRGPTVSAPLEASADPFRNVEWALLVKAESLFRMAGEPPERWRRESREWLAAWEKLRGQWSAEGAETCDPAATSPADSAAQPGCPGESAGRCLDCGRSVGPATMICLWCGSGSIERERQ